MRSKKKQQQSQNIHRHAFRKRGKFSKKMSANFVALKNTADANSNGISSINTTHLHSGKRLKSSKKLKRRLKRARGKNNSQVAATMETSTNVQMPDSTPLTANGGISNGNFQKFKDTSRGVRFQHRNLLKRKVSPNQGQNTAKSAFVKLIRSIKRRRLSSLTRQASTLRRKLNYLREDASSLEEGEIVSDANATDLDSPRKQLKSSQSQDDDCICIEPQIEQIVIDDDTPSTSAALKSTDQTKNKIKQGKMITSTPWSKIKNDLAYSPSQSTLNLSGFTKRNAEQPSFFEDVSRVPWFESINSSDTFTDYTKLTTLRDKRVQKRRSSRLNRKPRISDDLIVINDTLNDSTLVQKKEESSDVDDSVVFISETNPNKAVDFIPLSDDPPAPLQTVPNPFHPAKQNLKKKNDLFTSKEEKELRAYNDNAYNPTSGSSEVKSKKRMVIIDGSNVAFNHSLNREFSVKGLKICIDYFVMMGHEVKAVVPLFRLHKCSDPPELLKLHQAGRIVLTPCKVLPGKTSASYDDRFVLQLASELDAVIVSNDNYRDLVNENMAFKKIIENRVVSFTWCNDIFIVAKDPYGRWGPSLESILNRS